METPICYCHTEEDHSAPPGDTRQGQWWWKDPSCSVLVAEDDRRQTLLSLYVLAQQHKQDIKNRTFNSCSLWQQSVLVVFSTSILCSPKPHLTYSKLNTSQLSENVEVMNHKNWIICRWGKSHKRSLDLQWQILTWTEKLCSLTFLNLRMKRISMSQRNVATAPVHTKMITSMFDLPSSPGKIRLP